MGKVREITDDSVESVGSSNRLCLGIMMLVVNIILPGIGTILASCCIEAPAVDPQDFDKLALM